MHACVPCVCLVPMWIGQMKTWDPLELELSMVVSQWGVENVTRFSVKADVTFIACSLSHRATKAMLL